MRKWVRKEPPHRKYSKEEKMKYIRLHLDDHVPIRQIEREYGIGNALVSSWVNQIVASDMTVLKNKGKQWEWTLLVDTFNHEIIAHSVSPIAGDNKPYYHCLDKLNSLAGKREERRSQVVFHTDQGAVYSSRAFCHAHEHYNILRSMSRGGTPTDNPIMEALNGWIKEELYLDYGWQMQRTFLIC